MWKIQWSSDDVACVNSIRELDPLLDRLHEEHQDVQPILATVESTSNGDSLAIGLGRPQSVLTFVPGSGDPPYFSSVGDGEGDEVLEFSFMGDLSEIPVRNAVPIAVARQAMREFIETGALSKKVRWEQD
jgi:hypothetical protein